MKTAKLSSKSQITMPRKVREHLRVVQGDRIGFEETPDGRFIIGKVVTPHKSDGAARRRLKGMVPPQPAEITEAVTQAVMEDDRRTREGR
jgi:bifunctional DNA-binding transcriptional regulator/antitoxin component of YhaV-PrlF toxin-antitoxin module